MLKMLDGTEVGSGGVQVQQEGAGAELWSSPREMPTAETTFRAREFKSIDSASLDPLY